MPDDFIPQALINEPTIWMENAEYLTGFYALSTSRPVGFNGPLAIQVSEILAYCQIFEIEDVTQFFYRVRAADQAFLDWHNKKAEQGNS